MKIYIVNRSYIMKCTRDLDIIFGQENKDVIIILLLNKQ
jgi:hypothetical protein